MSIKQTVMQAVVQVMPDRDQDALRDAQRVIGKPIDRLDGRDKVTGAARFSAEFELEGLCYAALAYSTIAKGSIKSIDVAEAERAPGVIKVITHENAPKMKAPPIFSPGSTDAAGSNAKVLNTNEIFWNGQPIAVVVADTLERAEYAAFLIKAEYKQAEPATSFEQGKAHTSVPKEVMMEDNEVKHGDAEAALASSQFSVDRIYQTPRYNHNAIELHATTAVWDRGKLTVYDASQNIANFGATLAKIFSLKPEDVRVLAPYVGGGFGGKGSLWPHVQLCVLAAKVVERPVKLVVSREGVFRIVGGRTPSEQRVALGADKDGKFKSLIHTGLTAESFTNEFPEQFTFPARRLYASETMYLQQKVTRLNTVANTFMRAPGESIGTFALESAVDELAYALEMDPVALRLRNDAEREPAKRIEFSSRHFKQAFELGADKFDWRNRPSAVASQRDGEWMVGQGVATAFYPAYRYPASAKVRLNADGTALVQSGGQEMGMGTATVQTQHAAERLGLPMEKVRFEYGDTNLPNAPVAGGSNQTISIVLAVQQACENLNKELLALLKKDSDSPLAGLKVDDVQAGRSGLYRKDNPQQGESYTALLARVKKDFVEAESQTGKPLEMQKYSMASYGAQFCEVRVNAITGETRISRWVGAFDTGRILNAKTARSQFLGGIIMGIGMALTEETFFDERSGRITNPSLAEYHVPVNLDIPNIDVHFLDIPDPYTPLGAHGIGEIGITGAAAAVANAVYHATGKRIRKLPITLDKLM